MCIIRYDLYQCTIVFIIKVNICLLLCVLRPKEGVENTYDSSSKLFDRASWPARGNSVFKLHACILKQESQGLINPEV